MSLKEQLQIDLHQAMRNKDRTRVSVLRMLRSSIGYEEIEKKEDLSDSNIVDLLSRQVRQCRESIYMYGQGNRQDLVDKEEAELAILQGYMPAQLNQDALVDLAKGVITEVGAIGARDKGKVMGRLMPQVRGKAEGSVVNKVVSKLLAELDA